MLIWKRPGNPAVLRLLKPIVSLRHSSSPAIRIADLLEGTHSQGEPAAAVTVNGFLRSIRKQRQIAFAALGDGTTLQPLQVVLTPEQAKPLSNGAAVTVRGKWTPSLGGKKQAFELVADQVEVQGDNDAAAYPIQKKYHTAEFLRTLPHLRVRTPRNALLLRLRSLVIAEVTSFFLSQDFVQTHPPIITSSDCEGAGEVFTVEDSAPVEVEAGSDEKKIDPEPFFGSPKYLTVSSQLHLEALAQSVSRVWTLSPTFRAEHSDTSRHLSEFYMLEAEMAFTSNLDDAMDIVEKLLRHVVSRLKDSRTGKELLQGEGHQFERLEDENGEFGPSLLHKWEKLLGQPWPRVTYHQVREKLKQAEEEGRAKFDSPLEEGEGGGLQAEHEKFIAEELFDGPVFVTNYPRAIKPFYMALSSKAAEQVGTEPTVECFDLLLPEVCEVVGGSLREHRLDILEPNMRQHGVENLDWYLDLRRYGSVPHGGFGLGFDRFLAFLAGVKSIRDVVTFPRHYKRCLT